MGLIADLTTRFQSLPREQRILLGVGVPVAAGAALVGQIRRPAIEAPPANGEGVSGPSIPLGGDFLTFGDFNAGIRDVARDLRDEIRDIRDVIEDGDDGIEDGDDGPTTPTTPPPPAPPPIPTPTPPEAQPSPTPQPPEDETSPSFDGVVRTPSEDPARREAWILRKINGGPVLGEYPTRLACAQASGGDQTLGCYRVLR